MPILQTNKEDRKGGKMIKVRKAYRYERNSFPQEMKPVHVSSCNKVKNFPLDFQNELYQLTTCPTISISGRTLLQSSGYDVYRRHAVLCIVVAMTSVDASINGNLLCCACKMF
jgi:hypothetical protein